MRAAAVIPFCLASMVSFSAFGVEMDARFAKDDKVCGGYEVFHVNGVLTDFDGATKNIQQLALAYGNSYKEHLISFKLAYNQTRDKDGDLIDCFNQVLQQYPGTTLEEFNRAVVLGITSNILTANIVSMLSKKWAALFNMDRPAAYTDQDVTNVANAIYGNHVKNNRILLIPHSQGNFYVNTIYPNLIAGAPYGSLWAIPAKAIQTLGLASPANKLEGGGTHITSTNDRVINAVRLMFKDTKPGNITIPVIDVLGHNLMGVYLRVGYPGRKAIVDGMTARMNLLKATAQAQVSWLRGQAEYVRCGPAAWPYGTGVEPVTEIQCPIVRYTSVYPYSYLWIYSNQDYVKYTPLDTTPNKLVDYEYILGGAASQAGSLAKAYIEGCYKAYLADRRAQIAAGVPASPYYPSKSLGTCGNGFPSNYPYGYSDAAWNIYSGDLPYMVLPLMSANVKADMYQADLKPRCNW